MIQLLHFRPTLNFECTELLWMGMTYANRTLKDINNQNSTYLNMSAYYSNFTNRGVHVGMFQQKTAATALFTETNDNINHSFTCQYRPGTINKIFPHESFINNQFFKEKCVLQKTLLRV